MDAEALLRSILRSETPRWPAGSNSRAEDRFLSLCAAEGMVPLALHRLRAPGAAEGWPDLLIERLTRAALETAAIAELRERQLRELLPALAQAGARAILMKGAPLARTHYEDPALRPSGDADLFITPLDRDVCRRTLEALGFVQQNETDGRLVTYQHHFARRDAHGIGLIVDLHWKINNPQVFANALSFDEADAEAVEVPSLGSTARALAPVHALFHALVHRVAHDDRGTGLIALSDVDRLVAAMHPAELDRFERLTIERHMAAVAAGGLRAARDWFATTVPDRLVQALDRAAARRPELSAQFLNRSRRPVDTLVSDLRALVGWRARARLLREHALPPPTYLLRSYGVSSRLLLPGLYAHRLVAGARRWLRRS